MATKTLFILLLPLPFLPAVSGAQTADVSAGPKRARTVPPYRVILFLCILSCLSKFLFFVTRVWARQPLFTRRPPERRSPTFLTSVRARLPEGVHPRFHMYPATEVRRAPASRPVALSSSLFFLSLSARYPRTSRAAQPRVPRQCLVAASTQPIARALQLHSVSRGAETVQAVEVKKEVMERLTGVETCCMAEVATPCLYTLHRGNDAVPVRATRLPNRSQTLCLCTFLPIHTLGPDTWHWMRREELEDRERTSTDTAGFSLPSAGCQGAGNPLWVGVCLLRSIDYGPKEEDSGKKSKDDTHSRRILSVSLPRSAPRSLGYRQVHQILDKKEMEGEKMHT